MKSTILLSFLTTGSLLFANQTIQIENGWQLLGTTNCISDINQFNRSSINMIWAYDKNSLRWSAYSPDLTIQNAIDSSGSIDNLTKIEQNRGFWVNANYNDYFSIITQDSNITDINITLQNPSEFLNDFPVADLTQEQKDGLAFMYQEEKVARDIYTKMYDKWDLKIFLNISRAEQIHMDAIKEILIKYDLEIPIIDDTVGEFDLDALQELYNQLIVLGDISLNEALKVGVLVEETDIADLEQRIVDVPEDISGVYQNLLDGSYKHLNAFNKQIQ